jgi:hypothetical protein
LTDVLDRLGTRVAPGEPLERASANVVEVATPRGKRRYNLAHDLSQADKDHIETLVARTLEDDANVVRIMSPQLMRTVDRAVRSPESWQLPDGGPPRFVDPDNHHTVEIENADMTREALWDTVKTLNPRTADVWRLLTAHALEAWSEGLSEPPPVWLDVRQLLEAMGYQQFKNGGWKPEYVHAAARALKTIEDMWVIAQAGSEVYDTHPVTKRRRKSVLQARRRHRVVTISAVDEMRDLFGESYPLRWQIKPGPWILEYPREIAVILKALVKTPAQGAVQIWAKALGMELSFVYSKRARGVARLQVRRLLERAGLIAQVEEWAGQRNNARAKSYFESALDMLEQLGVCQSWQYDAEDFAALERAPRPQKFEAWLASHVLVLEPPYIQRALLEDAVGRS